MFEGRSIEFFEVNGTLAIRNLIVLIGSLTASVVVVFLAVQRALSGEVFAAYCTLIAAVFGVAKWQDDQTRRSKINLNAPHDVTNTTINQPDKVNVAGDAVTKTTRKKS